MQRWTTLGTITALAFMLAACNQPADTHDADVKAIQDFEMRWNQDWAAKDPAKLMTYYAGDAVVIAPGAPADLGADAIRTTLKQMTADPALSLKFHASRVEVAKSGDIAYTLGSYTMEMTDPQSKQIIHDHGSYVTTYHKQADGTWKAVADIATSEVPPPAPMPAPVKKG